MIDSLLRSATYIIEHAGANQIATHLQRDSTAAHAAAASQPAGWYRPTAYGSPRYVTWHLQ